eukprot:Pgem_evm1s15133
MGSSFRRPVADGYADILIMKVSKRSSGSPVIEGHVSNNELNWVLKTEFDDAILTIYVGVKMQNILTISQMLIISYRWGTIFVKYKEIASEHKDAADKILFPYEQGEGNF